MTHSPQFSNQFPAHGGGAISGVVLPVDAPCPMDDDAMAVREYMRRVHQIFWPTLPAPMGIRVSHQRRDLFADWAAEAQPVTPIH